MFPRQDQDSSGARARSSATGTTGIRDPGSRHPCLAGPVGHGQDVAGRDPGGVQEGIPLGRRTP
jgi:hypothetical protein